MNLRHTIVSRLDREMPRAMSTMRYAFHVGLRGKVVYPKVTHPFSKFLDRKPASRSTWGPMSGCSPDICRRISRPAIPSSRCPI